MTKDEKSRVVELRRKGMGYIKIAQAIGVSENTVKTFCRRNGLTGTTVDVQDVPEDLGIAQKPCLCCGKMVAQYPGRKEKKYCSDDCRTKWWNSHIGEVKRKAMHDYTCPTCGKTFSAYGKRHRKYCSHECYITDRFGGVACG